MRLIKSHWTVFALAATLLASGCAPAPSTPPAGPPPNNDPRGKIPAGLLPAVDRFDAGTDLHQLGEMYKAATVDRGPANVQEMGNLQLQAPQLYKAIQEGRYVLYWGVNPLAPANAVLGYEKDAPSKGGVVLLMDGSVHPMSAEEFKTAPKAGQ
jgi:hypothetical protein